jgi:chromosome partitioning protein
LLQAQQLAPVRNDGVKPVPHATPSLVQTRSAAEPQPQLVEATPVQEQQAPTLGPKVLAVFNHKGGTGKTTTAVTIAAGLARHGHRTLIVDTDAQGNVAVSLGLNKITRSLYHVLVMGMPLTEAITQARPNLDVLAANETLAAAELYLAGRQNRDRILATRLAQARDNYDFIVVDCSPSLSLLNQNALVFADSVLCPVACDYLSLVGVRQVVKTIKNVNRLLSHPVQLWGVLPTLYDKRARICNEALETLREHFQERCLPPVRSAIRVKEAPSQGKTVFEYDADSDVAADYNSTVERILRDASESGANLNLATSSSRSAQSGAAREPMVAIA